MNPSDDPPQEEGLIKVAEIVARCPDAHGVVIVGACDASMPLRFRELLPAARILAIEALPENYVRWLAPHEEFESCCVAISDRSTAQRFYVQDRNGIHGLYDRGNQRQQRIVATTTLDWLLHFYNPVNWDIVVVDAEGAGPDVVDGGRETLAHAKVVAIELEDYAFFRGQRLGYETRVELAKLGFMRAIDRSAEIGPGQLQHEELWCR